jgi:hypothetical protein
LFIIRVCFYFSGSDTIADELNPLTISHPAGTISSKAAGRNKMIKIDDEGSTRLNIGTKP